MNVNQHNYGSGDNVGRDKNTYVNIPKVITWVILASVVLVAGNYINNRLNNKLDISGRWDTQSASEIIKAKLNEYESTVGFGMVEVVSGEKKPIKHIIHDFDWVDLQGRQSYFATVFSVFEDESYYVCGGCSAPASIFEFQKKEEGYKLVNEYINLETYVGQYSVPPEKVNIFTLGLNIFGLELIDIDEYYADGKSYEKSRVFTMIGDDLIEVFSYDKKEILPDDNNRLLATKKINILKEGTGFYDIELTELNQDEELQQKKVYFFNGNKYIEK